MPERNVHEIRPLVERDPKQLEWSIQDLQDFEMFTWSGGNVVMTVDEISRLRQATKVVVSAYQAGELVLGGPLREALEKDSEAKLAEHEEQFKAKESDLSSTIEDITHERSEYQKAYDMLQGATEDTLSDLEEIETIGDSNPLQLTIDVLRENQDKAADIVGQLYDNLS